MKIVFYLLLLVIFSMTLSGCLESPDGKALESALQMAGENRKELEKVLEYFRSDPQKYEAAVFLISNMPGHKSYGGQIMENYYSKLISEFSRTPAYIMVSLLCLPPYFVDIEDFPDIEDIYVINADFLIDHINSRFLLYESLPWKDNLSKSDFFEYILPYRVGNEPLKYIMEYPFKKEFLSPEDSLRYCNGKIDAIDDTLDILTLFDAQNDVMEIIEKYVAGYKYPFPVSSVYFPECISIAYKELLQHRIMGIPGAIDFVPAWPDRNRKHYWHTPYQYLQTGIPNDANYKFAKVYRKTYSRNAYPKERVRTYIPSEFNTPFLKDVTDHYTITRDLSLKLPDTLGSKNIYLAVFNNLEWTPVAWTQAKKNKVSFSKVGVNCLYVPMAYSGRESFYFGYPVFVKEEGTDKEFKPDKQKTVTLTLNRKYPLSTDKKIWAEGVWGMELQATNDPDFNDYQTIGKINGEEYLPFYIIPVNIKEKYRYWRLLNHTGKTVYIAEIVFSDQQGINFNQSRITPTIIREPGKTPQEFNKSRFVALSDYDNLTNTFFWRLAIL